MHRYLLCLFLLIFQVAFSFSVPELTEKYADSIYKEAGNVVVETSSLTSLSFIKALEDKFPEDQLGDNSIPVADNDSPEFSWENLEKEYPVSIQVGKQRDEAREAFRKIEEGNLWTGNFSNEDIVSLPIGIKKTVGGVEYSLGIIEAEVGAEFTELTAFVKITIQQTDENGQPLELFFGADDVRLSHQGGIIGNAKLVLLGDLQIPYNGGKWLLNFNGSLDYGNSFVRDLTYVTIDCAGVKDMALNGVVEFSRELILPINSYGKVNELGRDRVKGHFDLVVENWNDILVNITLSPFVRAQKRNSQDYKGNLLFYVQEAVLDFSDLRNSEMDFPKYYTENSLLMPNENTWKGIYVEAFEVGLPLEFQTKQTIENNQRLFFGARNLIIDSYGISGNLSAHNLFPLKQGRTNKENGWAYSMDFLEIELAANHLMGADFSGRILLPISKGIENREVGLEYQGFFTEEEYMVKVATASVVNFELWQAQGQLEPNSSIEFKVVENHFRPKAILHGNLSISADRIKNSESEQASEIEERATVRFQGIHFQDLILQSDSPVLSVGYLGYRDEVEFANFPVSINNIALVARNDQASLFFDLKFNLMDGAGFGADARIGILADKKISDYKQKWVYSGLDISAIGVDADMGGFSIYGSLHLMEDDPEYGNGFSADLTARFGALSNIKLQAQGIFGRVDGFRYWYFDALVENIGIPGSPGLITPTGFSGGAYYKMSRTGFGSGFSPSGLAYTPDKNQGLGVKSMLLFSMGAQGAIDGSAGFEILFNRNGGISRMGLFGSAKFMGDLPFGGDINNLLSKVKEDSQALDAYLGITGTGSSGASSHIMTKPFLQKAEMDFPKAPKRVGVEALVGMEFDFANSVIHGKMDVYVNVAGGAVQGRASRGRAGWGALHVSPNEWYLHLGNPADRLGLKMGVGPVHVESGGYFMMGDRLPTSTPPPPIVAEILGTDAQSLSYGRDENALSKGRGFAFGSDFSIDTGDLNFLMFYARFHAGAGFDMMLRDYGKAVCANRNDGQIGINGWYANGQGYAYLQGELGINIKLFFVRKKIPIVRGAAAVLLQAKAPNPVWMRGYVGGHFNLLGGMVKGDYRFKLTIGEACELQDASTLGGMRIISDVTPVDGSKGIDVFTAPQVTFNMKVNTPIVIPEDEGDVTYKVVMEKFTLLHKGKEKPGKIEWGSNNNRATFVSADILPPNQSLTVEVEVSFQEQKDGVFKTVMVDGEKVIEKEVRKFVTGKAPTVIPLQNIEYSYPVIEQQYFLKDEHNEGYVKLVRGQDYLFDNVAWTTEVVFTDQNGKEQPVRFNYDRSDNRVYYDFPKIENDYKYRMAITSRSKNAGRSSRGRGNEYKKTISEGGNSISLRETKANSVVREEIMERLSYNFETSIYDTFAEKIRKIKTTENNWGKISSDVIFLSNKIQSHEAFDVADLIGTEFTANKPLVVAEATLEDDYYQKDMYRLYRNYPLNGDYRVEYRKESEFGLPPKKAVPIISSYRTLVEHGISGNWLLETFPYYYNLPIIYKQDWVNLRSQVLNDFVEGLIPPSNPVTDLIDVDYPFMRYGRYTIYLQYVLPGGKKGTGKEYNYKNIIKFR